MADAGSKPATSTKFRNAPNRSKPTQASNSAACSGILNTPHLVQNGQQRPAVRLNSVTNSSQNSIDALCDSLRGIGSRECHDFRKAIFYRHHNLAQALGQSYLETVQDKSYVDANRNLLRLDDRLCIKDLNLSSSEDELQAFCRKQANTCKGHATRLNYSPEAFDLCSLQANQYRITAPQPKDYQGDIYPCLKRLSNEKWWRKKVYSLQRKTVESVARDLGLVCQQRNAYASQRAIDQRTRQKIKNREYLENTYIENDLGQRYSLLELHDRSVSNPKVRRSELMTRIKGFEMVADQLGHCGEFYTLTTPSRMHARFKRGGKNQKYDGTTPDQAHKYLTDLFCCIRAKLHREGITVYGLRVVEPNHDGTPHWHLLLFMKPEVTAQVREVFETYALKDSGDEKGASKHRFTAKSIDPSRGSAAGYVAKYISKNIDGAHIESDNFGNDSAKAAQSIDAWASTYNIRQFQFLGGPSVTIWRELRKLANSPEALPPDYPSAMREALQAADSAEWAAYVMLMGGPTMRKSERPIQPIYDRKAFFDTATGEINTEALSMYGDIKAPKVIGLVNGTFRLITHLRKWLIVAGHAATGGGQAHALPPRGAAPWTCVNKCTQ